MKKGETKQSKHPVMSLWSRLLDFLSRGWNSLLVLLRIRKASPEFGAKPITPSQLNEHVVKHFQADRKSLKKAFGSQLSNLVAKGQPPRETAEFSQTPSFELFLTNRAKDKVEEIIGLLTSDDYKELVDESLLTDLKGANKVTVMAKLLYQSKLPKSFAESAGMRDGLLTDVNGSSWSNLVYSALEGLYVKADVETYHSAKPIASEGDFNKPKPVELWCVPGPVLTGGAMELEIYKYLAPNEDLDADKYRDEMIQRILPVMQAVQDSAKHGENILFKVPGISCGFFGGVWKLESKHFFAQTHLRKALEQILSENKFENINGVVLDTWATGSLDTDVSGGGGKYTQDINGTKFIAITSEQYNKENVGSEIYQNSDATVYDDSFSGYREVALCAADTLSLPGNDMNVGSYATNEGWWGGCCNLLTKIFGISVAKKKVDGVYYPDTGNSNVHRIFTDNKLKAKCDHIDNVRVLAPLPGNEAAPGMKR